MIHEDGSCDFAHWSEHDASFCQPDHEAIVASLADIIAELGVDLQVMRDAWDKKAEAASEDRQRRLATALAKLTDEEQALLRDEFAGELKDLHLSIDKCYIPGVKQS